MYDYHYVNINNKHGIKINHYLLTQLGLFKTLKLNICVKISAKTKPCLNLVNIRKIQSSTMIQTET